MLITLLLETLWLLQAIRLYLHAQMHAFALSNDANSPSCSCLVIILTSKVVWFSETHWKYFFGLLPRMNNQIYARKVFSGGLKFLTVYGQGEWRFGDVRDDLRGDVGIRDDVLMTQSGWSMLMLESSAKALSLFNRSPASVFKWVLWGLCPFL